jgi:photosystem II stability/assembly factor-like uncharacterized protein
LIIIQIKKNNTGRMLCVAIHPTDPNIVYAGSNTGGLWKTVNALTTDASQVTWVCKTDRYFGMGVKDIAMHPTDPNIIYIVTQSYSNGMNRHGTYSMGVYKSTDAGQSWTRILPINPADVIALREIEIDPSNANRIYVAELEKVHVTADGGQTWNTYTITTGELGLDRLVLNKVTPNVLYCSGYKGLFVSTDNGQTWSNNCPFTATNGVVIDYSYVEGALYAQNTEGTTNNVTIKKSFDNGLSWQKVLDNSFLHGNQSQIIKIDPDGNIFAGGVKIYKSSFKSINFNNLQDTMHSDTRGIAFIKYNGQTIGFMANDGGIVRNTNGTKTGWTSINGNLNVAQIYSVDIFDSDLSMYITGLHDCCSLLQLSNNWAHVNGSDGGTSIIDYSNPAKVGTTAGDWHGTFSISSDFGKINTYNSSLTLDQLDAPIVQNPLLPNILYGAQSQLIMKSENFGNSTSWVQIANLGNIVSALGISKSNPNIIYAASKPWGGGSFGMNLFKIDDDGSLVSINGDIPINVLENSISTSIAVDLDNANKESICVHGKFCRRA